MILIDPPVSAYSDLAAIRAWIRELEELRRTHAGEEADLRLIDASLEEARGWLVRREMQESR